jgi:tRNA threonylcarbamoyladenosine biosynthesis protein TsaE
MGVRDYFDGNAICFIEWPEKGEGILPQADIEFEITPWQLGRQLNVSALTEQGSAQLGLWIEINQ